MRSNALGQFADIPAFDEAWRLQRETLRLFYSLAQDISGPQCPAGGIPQGMLDFRRNVFSTFFLAVTRKTVGGDSFMKLYAMVNQGMRAWVTACDNILDDEYKSVFDFAIAGQGPRMRSVLTLMLADRIVQRYVLTQFKDLRLADAVLETSLRALLPSALQECQEEARSAAILSPEQILNEIHRPKTADLFAAPLQLPARLESVPQPRLAPARTALMRFGQACQIIDDIKDMAMDVQGRRHNLLVSIIHAETDSWTPPAEHEWIAWEKYPHAVQRAQALARGYFHDAFAALGELGLPLKPRQQAGLMALIYTLLGVVQVPREGEGGCSGSAPC
ncbi:MAG: class 1 isoprenoid biosynthesis enzyme [Desulfobacterales bacterium]